MPWIKKEEREELEEKFKSLKHVNVGQGTYLFYKRFLQLWNKEQRYKTIHFIGLLRERPELDNETWELRNQLLFKNLNKSEVMQCVNDAHHQMERLYFDPYEDKKLKENGEINV